MAVRKSANSGEKTTRTGPETAYPKESKKVNGSAVAAEHHDLSNIPQWRKIEILRERAELKRHLKEIWNDDVDIEDLSMAEDEQLHDRYYTAATGDVNELEDFDANDSSDLGDVED